MGAIAEDLTYDAALAQLEAILATLEGDDLPLEQALTLYEEGALLAAFCARKLEEAELRVQRWQPGEQTVPLTGWQEG
ncbi:MAG: exodeoxyribonuclease VII small subunit [Anaerolineales bacterium]|nr:exodeoxyribonuclease VII small subunit [Anaerolineales bacterium]